MRPVDARKLTPDLGRGEWPTLFATDEASAPGWVTTGHFAVYVGLAAAQGFPGKVPYDQFVYGTTEPRFSLGALLANLRALVPQAEQVTEDPSFRIPSTRDDAGQCVYFRGARRVCIQEKYATLLEGLKVVHLGDERDPLLGLDPGENLVAVILPYTTGETLRKPVKKRRAV